jgi:hypothetical protein
MINALQLILLIPLFSLSFPANVQLCFSILIDISNFNVLPSSAGIFKFTGTDEGYNGNFEALGYESTNAIVNLQSTFYFFFLPPTFYLFMYLLGKCRG